MNPQLQGSSPSLQGGSITGGLTLQGSSPKLQASNNSSMQLQPAAPNSISLLQSGQNSINSSQNLLNNSGVNQAITQANNESASIAALLKSIQAEVQADAPGQPVSLNLNQLNSQAQANAANTVNPLYTQYLNQYLQQEAANKQSAESQNALNIQGEQSALGNTLAQNQLAESAAANTNSLTQGNINVQQQNYELQSGNAEDAKIQAIGSAIGSGNLGASGLGQQQLYQAENAKNVADAAQRGAFQYQRDTSNLSTADTFAQLAQSSQYATTAEGQQEAQTNFNLNDYLRQAAYNDTQYQQALEASRQQALTSTTAQDEAQLVQQQISARTGVGSKNYAASESLYSNLLNPDSSMPSAPNQSDYFNSYNSSV